MNWYYADLEGGHTTADIQFESDDDAIWYFVIKGKVETVYNCGPTNEDETIIWRYEYA
jgi:hypothetical protein